MEVHVPYISAADVSSASDVLGAADVLSAADVFQISFLSQSHSHTKIDLPKQVYYKYIFTYTYYIPRIAFSTALCSSSERGAWLSPFLIILP